MFQIAPFREPNNNDREYRLTPSLERQAWLECAIAELRRDLPQPDTTSLAKSASQSAGQSTREPAESSASAGQSRRQATGMPSCSSRQRSWSVRISSTSLRTNWSMRRSEPQPDMGSCLNNAPSRSVSLDQCARQSRAPSSQRGQRRCLNVLAPIPPGFLPTRRGRRPVSLSVRARYAGTQPASPENGSLSLGRRSVRAIGFHCARRFQAQERGSRHDPPPPVSSRARGGRCAR